MKYYLRITDVGIVIRDNNIVNHVAAPTKIAEYVTSGVQLLYSGSIGILADLSKIKDNDNMIELDKTADWEKLLKKRNDAEDVSVYVDYFDMAKRQLDTLKLLEDCFELGLLELAVGDDGDLLCRSGHHLVFLERVGAEEAAEAREGDRVGGEAGRGRDPSNGASLAGESDLRKADLR